MDAELTVVLEIGGGPLVLATKMVQKRHGCPAEAAAGFRTEAWRMWASFLMAFFLVVLYLCSASMVAIGACNFDGFDETFCRVAALVNCGEAAEVAHVFV